MSQDFFGGKKIVFVIRQIGLGDVKSMIMLKRMAGKKFNVRLLLMLTRPERLLLLVFIL